MTSSRVLAAPAKINLTLEILRKREDGYHGVRSVMVPVGLYDEITISGSESGLHFSCDLPELRDDGNLVLKALSALGLDTQHQTIHLQKRIPLQAGLGGGSSDAACILQAAMDGVFGPMPPRDWLQLARSLGSDVPFFLARTGALVEATGERITPVGSLPPWWCVVVMPAITVSTAVAFALLDANERVISPRSSSISLKLNDALQRADFKDVIALLGNDFHPLMLSLHPQIAATIKALEDAGAQRPILSGSGAACFALAPTQSDAQRIADALDVAPGSQMFCVPFVHDTAWRGRT